MTTTTIIGLDILCVMWIVAVMNDPWGWLLGVLKGLVRLFLLLAFAVPLVVAWVTGLSVVGCYLTEVVLISLFLGTLLSLKGLWTAAKSVAMVFQLMIALPGLFILVSIGYLTW